MKNSLLTTAAAVFGMVFSTLSQPALAQSASYEIDGSHTFVTFEVLHFGTSTARGRFDKKQGMIVLDKAAKTGKANITIDVASVNTGVKPLDAAILGTNFLKVAEFPTAQFVGDKFTFDGEKVSAVTGTLTLLGKSQPVTLSASNFNCYTSPYTKTEVCGGDFVTTVQRSAFGITHQPGTLGESVRLTIQIEAARQ